ncbi:MAG: hypothetical protein ISS45_00040 [Candidatus Omnitrophica bacterium]|nr:hypothetical protein [Candidatus Omnitrophota bacterium]
MNSDRLPGKVLRNVNGKPVIEYLIERLKKSNKIGKIIIATSIEKEDQAIVDYCKGEKIEFFRGPLRNVAKRFKDAIEKYELENFIRVCADSPLIDPDIIDAGIEIFRNGNYGIVTNTLKHTFPKGQSFEILRSDIFNQGYQDMEDEDDFEHVTRHFYRNSHRFLIYNMETETGDYSRVNLCIDIAEDLDLFNRILNKMNKPFLNYAWEEIVEIYRDIRGT